MYSEQEPRSNSTKITPTLPRIEEIPQLASQDKSLQYDQEVLFFYHAILKLLPPISQEGQDDFRYDYCIDRPKGPLKEGYTEQVFDGCYSEIGVNPKRVYADLHHVGEFIKRFVKTKRKFFLLRERFIRDSRAKYMAGYMDSIFDEWSKSNPFAK